MGSIIRVYDRNMKKLAYLQNAYNIGYELTLNELWYADFTMPADDPKMQFCEPFNFVEIFDGGERVELFRIMPSTLTRNTKGDIVYQCEHVLATLLDDVLFQYHQIGGGAIGTVAVLRYILDRQLENRWQLGVCEFDRRFEYKWENENLLAAMFSIPKPFNEGHRWEFDTTGDTWRINLKHLPTQFKADITYKKNMPEIKRIVDPTTIVTRLYCLGYGEGDNQLDIRSVNGGVPYLEANTSTWGIKSSILVDRRYESPETLKAYGQALLDELKNPYKSYSVQAVDLYRKSPEKYERFFPGDIVRIIDKEDGITEDLPIVKVSKSDITGSPGAVEVEIANKSRDIAGSISTLQERTRINEVYAQGATNQMIIPFADNADPDHPAVMRIYIPDTMVRINKCILNYQLEPFRAYSKAIEGGGGVTDSTSDGGGTSTTTEEGGSATEIVSEEAKTRTSDADYSEGHWDLGSNYTWPDVMQYEGSHNHGIPNGTALATADGGVIWYYQSGSHAHGLVDHSHAHIHTIEIPAHSHAIKIPSHAHSVKIDSHKHNITIPDHTHELEFGIYQGETASKVTLKIDGKTVSGTNPGQDIDIISFLSVDSGGKVNRNTWHEIEVIPDKMTRITANVFMQIFTNSRGGDDL